MDIHNEFIADEKNLVFYNGKAIINKRHAYYDVNGDPWIFSAAGAIGYTWKIWEEREGGLLLITWTSPTNITESGNELILNAPAEDTDIGIGRYYYEKEYLIAGGYSVLIAFGQAKFI